MRYSKYFSVRAGRVRAKRDYHLILEKPLLVAGRKKNELWFASVIQQKHNVGFYFLPVYFCEDVKAELTSSLLEYLDVKGCFHMKSPTPQLKRDINAALKLGLAA